jgi:methylated-DNA-[protein]-cysteine S-methyltransferase
VGQSGVLVRAGEQIDDGRCVEDTELRLSVFLTDFGWLGLLGHGQKTAALTIGHISADGAREAIARMLAAENGEGSMPVVEFDWFPQLRQRLESYAQGEPVDFSDYEIETQPQTPFQKRVLAVTRRIRYGTTVTYAQLAERAGAPRAARAVGSVMASNRVPIFIPCHRVVAAGGKLGGFSAPQGISLKQQLLTMEAHGTHSARST